MQSTYHKIFWYVINVSWNIFMCDLRIMKLFWYVIYMSWSYFGIQSTLKIVNYKKTYTFFSFYYQETR